jgi:hypothetical protein
MARHGLHEGATTGARRGWVAAASSPAHAATIETTCLAAVGKPLAEVGRARALLSVAVKKVWEPPWRRLASCVGRVRGAGRMRESLRPCEAH